MADEVDSRRLVPSVRLITSRLEYLTQKQLRWLALFRGEFYPLEELYLHSQTWSR